MGMVESTYREGHYQGGVWCIGNGHSIRPFTDIWVTSNSTTRDNGQPNRQHDGGDPDGSGSAKMERAGGPEGGGTGERGRRPTGVDTPTHAGGYAKVVVHKGWETIGKVGIS